MKRKVKVSDESVNAFCKALRDIFASTEKNEKEEIFTPEQLDVIRKMIREETLKDYTPYPVMPCPHCGRYQCVCHEKWGKIYDSGTLDSTYGARQENCTRTPREKVDNTTGE
jgi:hypothetical protein